MRRATEGSVRARVLGLDPSAFPVSASELADQLDVSLATARSAVKRMVAAGELVQPQWGLYALAPGRRPLDAVGLAAARAAMVAALSVGFAAEDAALGYAIRCYLAREYVPPADADALAVAVRDFNAID